MSGDRVGPDGSGQIARSSRMVIAEPGRGKVLVTEPLPTDRGAVMDPSREVVLLTEPLVSTGADPAALVAAAAVAAGATTVTELRDALLALIAALVQ